MPRIKVMNDDLANKIAAGEVVERPASVVKELVENAIDAGSSIIDVSVSDGGLERIRIVDNGVGMEREDALLSFARHASSKITSEQDLFRISTLGFRGGGFTKYCFSLLLNYADMEWTGRCRHKGNRRGRGG